MPVSLDDLHGVLGLADGELDARGEDLGAAVERDQVEAVAALDAETDDARVGDDERADVQRVRGDGAEDEVAARGGDDGPVDAEGIGRRTGGGGDDEAVGLVGRQVVVAHEGVDGDHRRAVALEDGDLVEGVIVAPEGALVGVEAEERPFLYLIIVLEDLVERVLDLIPPHIRQEAQAAGVDAEDRDATLVDAGGGAKESAVAAEAEGEGKVELVAGEESADGGADVHRRAQVIVEGLVDEDLGLEARQLVEQAADDALAPRLMLTAKNAYFHAFVVWGLEVDVIKQLVDAPPQSRIDGARLQGAGGDIVAEALEAPDNGRGVGEVDLEDHPAAARLPVHAREEAQDMGVVRLDEAGDLRQGVVARPDVEDDDASLLLGPAPARDLSQQALHTDRPHVFPLLPDDGQERQVVARHEGHRLVQVSLGPERRRHQERLPDGGVEVVHRQEIPLRDQAEVLPPLQQRQVVQLEVVHHVQAI